MAATRRVEHSRSTLALGAPGRRSHSPVRLHRSLRRSEGPQRTRFRRSGHSRSLAEAKGTHTVCPVLDRPAWRGWTVVQVRCFRRARKRPECQNPAPGKCLSHARSPRMSMCIPRRSNTGPLARRQQGNRVNHGEEFVIFPRSTPCSNRGTFVVSSG